MTHPDKNRLSVDDETFMNVNNAYRYLINPTTRLIYDSFGHSGLEVYEAEIDQYDELEKQHALAIQHEEDGADVEQQIFDKTLLLLSMTMRQRVNSEYSVSTTFELGFDFEN